MNYILIANVKDKIINSLIDTKLEIINHLFSTKSGIIAKECQESVKFLRKL